VHQSSRCSTRSPPSHEPLSFETRTVCSAHMFTMSLVVTMQLALPPGPTLGLGRLQVPRPSSRLLPLRPPVPAPVVTLLPRTPNVRGLPIEPQPSGGSPSPARLLQRDSRWQAISGGCTRKLQTWLQRECNSRRTAGFLRVLKAGRPHLLHRLHTQLHGHARFCICAEGNSFQE